MEEKDSGNLAGPGSQRFAVKLAVEFRQIGSDHWVTGYTENMSAGGVLFRTGEHIDPNSRIEMVFRMPVPSPCNLVCTGVVLRVEQPAQAGMLAAIAATIDHYSLVRVSEIQ
jgi:hypothetical protein